MRRIPSLFPLLLLLTGCPEARLRNTLPPDVLVDTYEQQSAAKVDVLWVVDNSGSMLDEQENLARNFQSFIDLFVRGSIDYRIGVTTTDVFKDDGQLKGAVISPRTANVAQAFAQNIRVGASGSPYEAGLQAAQRAIERQQEKNAPQLQQVETCKLSCKDAACIQACPDKYPVEFLRPDAYLYLIFVSDEEDKSTHDVRYYWRAFETATGIGNDGTVTTAAIVGTQAQNPCAAAHGTRYLALSALTGGEVGSICDGDFAVTLRKLASSAVGLRRKFAVTRKPNPETLEVTLRYPCETAAETLASCGSVDRAECEGAPGGEVLLVCTPKQGGADGWSYEPEAQVIYFAGESVPGLKARVDIQYYEEGKP